MFVLLLEGVRFGVDKEFRCGVENVKRFLWGVDGVMAGPGKRDEVAGGVCARLLSCEACGIDVSKSSVRSSEEKV
jgi:hypothetical protein